ncbi:hypothetical protein [Actinomadura sp. 9N407]|uniref:hypothetical protein n=1 Tax=Actinomadura sp. 9N407 TaxID=3375154 RepID=UPI0037B2CA39
MPIEDIVDLCGHSSMAVTEAVYWYQLRSLIAKGAAAINAVFGESRTEPMTGGKTGRRWSRDDGSLYSSSTTFNIEKGLPGNDLRSPSGM